MFDSISHFRRNWLPALGIVFLTALVYLPSTRAGFIWDDVDYVLENHSFTTLSGLFRLWTDPKFTDQYYPLVNTLFWIEHHFWQFNPLGYHTVNILLHILGSVVFGFVLIAMEIPGAWLAATLFAIHPLQVESVSWVHEGKNVASFLWLGLSLLTYLKFLNGRSPKKYLLSITFFLAALLCKTTSCCLPMILLLWQWQKPSGLKTKDVLALAPFFALAVALGSLTSWLEVTQVGAVGTHFQMNLAEHLILAGRILEFYLGKIFWPHPQMFIYPRWNIDSRDTIQWLFPLAGIGLIAWLWVMKKRWGKTPVSAALIYGAILFPALGFFRVYPMLFSFVADHFQYVAATVPIAVVASVMTQLSKKGKPAFYAISLLFLIALLSSLTWHRQAAFQNEAALWNDTLEKNPQAWIASNNLGVLHAKEGKWESAEFYFEHTLSLKKDHFPALLNLAVVKSNLRHYLEADSLFTRAIENSPNFAKTHFLFGRSLAERERWGEAKKEFIAALQLSPNSVQIKQALARIDLRGHGRDRAIRFHPKDIRHLPDDSVVKIMKE